MNNTQTTLEKEFAKFFNLNEKLQTLIESIQDRGGYPDTDRAILASGFLAKAAKTHNAILILCRNGYGEDSLILLRVLFDMMLNLTYMLKWESDMLIKRYMHWDYVQRKKLREANITNKMMKKMLDDAERESQTNRETTKLILKRAEEAQNAYNYTNSGWAPLNTFDMAKAVGMDGVYNTVFRMCSSYIHTSPTVLNDYYTKEENSSTFNYGPSLKSIDAVLQEVFIIMIDIVQQFANATKIIKDIELESLWNEFKYLSNSQPKVTGDV